MVDELPLAIDIRHQHLAIRAILLFKVVSLIDQASPLDEGFQSPQNSLPDVPCGPEF
jgi:hypothetical protein